MKFSDNHKWRKTGINFILMVLLLMCASCAKKESPPQHIATQPPKTDSQKIEPNDMQQAPTQKPPETRVQESPGLSPTEKAIVKYYVQLDFSGENPGFLQPPSELKKLKSQPVTDEDKKKDQEFFGKIESITQLWMQRNLLKTAVNFNKSPKIIQDTINKAMRQGEFAAFMPTDTQEQKLKDDNLKQFPEGRDMSELEKKLEQEVESLKSQTVKE